MILGEILIGNLAIFMRPNGFVKTKVKRDELIGAIWNLKSEELVI